ncbi:hypothetical protein WR25_17166 isoform A [Diploscapter pachys]|uniref:Neurotransmitter-gated ion-channel ligand-binding domain-containing protein n=1 Tax=Diploscapter pachys TaxID=2018661 RepID=A0A2A2LD18_9BILA|nr:hypothetical protein WR25_17166 isoform A [Diploscapter pachys]
MPRMLLAPLLALLGILLGSAQLLESSDIPEHYLLAERLLSRYNKGLIPKRLQNESIKVNFSMELYQIIQVDEPQQSLIINAWIVERWVDNLLGWDPERHSNVTEVMIEYDKIWIPDTTLYNSLVMDDSDSRRLLHAKLTTRGQGQGALVEMLYPTIYKSSCLLNLKFFPFDVQVCRLTFGSWSFDNTQIDYFPHNTTHAIGTRNCIENEGWNVLSTHVVRQNNKYECCQFNYTLLEFYMTIQRKPLYYVINLIIPTSIITLISIIGFFRSNLFISRRKMPIYSSSSINDLRQEKISLGITTLLSMSILIFMVSDKMPSTLSFIPLIGWFYTTMILEISIATLCSTLVIYVQKKGSLGKPPSHRTMSRARVVAKMIGMEMPLVMKVAYAKKMKEEKARRAALQQNGRKKSLWTKVYQLAREQGAARKNSQSSQKVNGVVSPEIGVIPSTARKCTISDDVTQIENSHLAVEEDGNQIDDEADSSLQEADLLTINKYTLTKSSTCNSFDSITRESIVKPAEVSVITPRSQQRNLVELEYDWLAAVLERVFLILFLLLFILCAVGINCFGLYFWWHANDLRPLI